MTISMPLANTSNLMVVTIGITSLQKVESLKPTTGFTLKAKPRPKGGGHDQITAWSYSTAEAFGGDHLMKSNWPHMG